MITGFNLRKDNLIWLRSINNDMEKKCKSKIGLSMIVNILIAEARGKRAELEKTIFIEKIAEKKAKAFEKYSKEIMEA